MAKTPAHVADPELLARDPDPTSEETSTCSSAFMEHRTVYVSQSPFIGMLLLYLKPFAAGVKIPTAAVTYDSIMLHAIEPGRLVNTDGSPYEGFTFQRLSSMAAKTLLAHEVLHLVFEHLDIPASFDHNIANMAQDAVINRIIMSDPYLDLTSLPPGGVIPLKDGNGYSGFKIGTGAQEKTFRIQGFADLDWQPIYWAILEQLEKESSGDAEQRAAQARAKAAALQGNNPMAGDIDYEQEGATSPDFDNSKLDMRARVIQAAENAQKQQGYLPAEVSRHLNDLKKGKIKWTDKLRRILRTQISRNDFMLRANPRRAALAPIWKGRRQPSILPSLHSESLGVGVLVLDTSGSMGKEEMTMGLSEFAGLRQTTPFDLYFFCVDAMAYKSAFYSKDEEPNWGQIMDEYIHGGGGTSFVPAFDWVAEFEKDHPGEHIAFLAYFTDGYGSFPETPPNYKVFWITTPHSLDKDQFPFGDVIPMKDEEYDI